jgi:hypothetical protein
MRRTHVLMALVAIAAVGVISTAVAVDDGGEATTAAKKKAKRGPAGPPGPQGPQGPAGPQGATGPAVPLSNTSFAAEGNDITDIGTGPLADNSQTMVGANVEASGNGSVTGTASVTVTAATAAADIECQFRIAGTLTNGVSNLETLTVGELSLVTFTGGRTVGPGEHDVDAQCREASGAGTINFLQGNVSAVFVEH